MSTYVPAAMTTSSPGLSNQHHQHQHRPAIGFNDVRTSASFHSFNGGGGGNSGETRNMSAGGGVSSLYSLSDSHCPSPVAMMTADSNAISNIDQIPGVHRQSEMTRPAAGRGGCHHLYWNRPVPRLASSAIGSSNNPNSENQLMSVRMPANNSQGSINCSNSFQHTKLSFTLNWWDTRTRRINWFLYSWSSYLGIGRFFGFGTV